MYSNSQYASLRHIHDGQVINKMPFYLHDDENREMNEKKRIKLIVWLVEKLMLHDADVNSDGGESKSKAKLAKLAHKAYINVTPTCKWMSTTSTVQQSTHYYIKRLNQ